MSNSLKVAFPLSLAAIFACWWFLRPHQPAQDPLPGPGPATATEAPHPALAPLGTSPNWKTLDIFQHSITRIEFESLLTRIFTTGDAWKSVITLTDSEAIIVTDPGKPDSGFHLVFAASGTGAIPPRQWKSSGDLPPAPPEKPLAGLKIAIDPGHIGGEWAKMEERWFSVGGAPPVCEGDLTLKVAQLLKPTLEGLGAHVSLVRETAQPLTPLRPKDLLSQVGTTEDPAKQAERLFYRTAEIRARAERVNQTLKPDLVLCLHFNAEPWGNPADPTLVDGTHFHLLVNGGYTDEEVLMEDQRFELLNKLLQRTHQEEVDIGVDVASSFFSTVGLPPYRYNPESRNARSVGESPYLWARNLLANRLYDCPVIFLEPYVMNSKGDYARIQAGDYEGLRPFGGAPKPSIFREYADSLATGLANHYRRARSGR